MPQTQTQPIPLFLTGSYLKNCYSVFEYFFSNKDNPDEYNDGYEDGYNAGYENGYDYNNEANN